MNLEGHQIGTQRSAQCINGWDSGRFRQETEVVEGGLFAAVGQPQEGDGWQEGIWILPCIAGCPGHSLEPVSDGYPSYTGRRHPGKPLGRQNTCIAQTCAACFPFKARIGSGREKEEARPSKHRVKLWVKTGDGGGS